ncbi:hypothetical protein [Streptomyces sp. NPDC008121]|uniref:hypothetical protein n=1 Tax=Streptomyces sp. NPDC008121 TaxID=3364809 RepID=UPI0036E04589
MAAAVFLAVAGGAPAAFADTPAPGNATTAPVGSAAPTFTTAVHIVNNSSHDLQLSGLQTINNLNEYHAYQDGPATEAGHTLTAHTTDTIDMYEMAGWNQLNLKYRPLDIPGSGKLVEVDFFIQGMNLSFRQSGGGPTEFGFDSSAPGTVVISDADA